MVVHCSIEWRDTMVGCGESLRESKNSNPHSASDQNTATMWMVPNSTPKSTPIPISEKGEWTLLLKQRGWCILEVPVSFWKDQYGSSADHRVWLDNPSSWTTLHRKLFESGVVGGGSARYVGAESGGGERNEPKQSWELQRSSSSSSSKTTNSVDRPLRAVLDLLHDVAVHVNDTCFEKDLSKRLIYDDGCSTSTQPFDLLRAFCYEPTGDDNVMGSTPHTDWGSFTVVWQDTVGGLQTYEQGEWMPVVPCEPPDGKNAVQLIVHVGDVTSLVTGYPSPLHRVVSPQTQHRHSFVYFLYPVPHATLRELQRCCGNGTPYQKDTAYEHYSLLQDQSAEGHQTNATARDRYEAMLDQPLADVFRHKWDQVQR